MLRMRGNRLWRGFIIIDHGDKHPLAKAFRLGGQCDRTGAIRGCVVHRGQIEGCVGLSLRNQDGGGGLEGRRIAGGQRNR